MVEERGAFQKSGRLVVDGEPALSFESVVPADGRMANRVSEPSVTTEDPTTH